MIERIRVSLWDIFSFFLTGFLAAVVIMVVVILYGPLTPKELAEALLQVPAALVIVAAPLALTLFGLVIEPFANYFDRFVMKPLFGWLIKPKAKHTDEEELLAEEIKANYLGSLCGKIPNPYAICKEYVETKQLSTTFMVFLSRYGFYRNCAFISVASGVAIAVLSRSLLAGVVAVVASVVVAIVFKRRAEDFYSYMAPAVYRAFLIDKLKWSPHQQNENAGTTRRGEA
jgi:hypothetical protein